MIDVMQERCWVFEIQISQSCVGILRETSVGKGVEIIPFVQCGFAQRVFFQTVKKLFPLRVKLWVEQILVRKFYPFAVYNNCFIRNQSLSSLCIFIDSL